jgi:hypothetical protein
LEAIHGVVQLLHFAQQSFNRSHLYYRSRKADDSPTRHGGAFLAPVAIVVGLLGGGRHVLLASAGERISNHRLVRA